MVFQFVSSPFAFKGSERKIDCSTKTKQIPPVIFLSKHRLLTPERHAKSHRRVFGVVNQPVKSSTYLGPRERAPPRGTSPAPCSGFRMYLSSTPSVETMIQIQIDVTFFLGGVGGNPCGFERFSEITIFRLIFRSKF